MGLITSFILIFVLQYALTYLFSFLGITNPIVVDTLIDVVLSFVFALIFYRGERKYAFKDPQFHKSVAYYFIFLIVFSMIYWFLF